MRELSQPANDVYPPCFWEVCKECGGSINIHRVIWVEPNQACETFDFCTFETGNDPQDGSTYCRYIFRDDTEAADPMDLDEFKELYS